MKVLLLLHFLLPLRVLLPKNIPLFYERYRIMHLAYLQEDTLLRNYTWNNTLEYRFLRILGILQLHQSDQTQDFSRLA